MNKRGMKKNFWVGLCTTFLVVLMVAAGPASAKELELSSHTQTVKQGNLATFFAAVKVKVNERFKVNYLTFSVFNKKGVIETCTFATDGTKISGCDFVKSIRPLDKEKHNEYGYHYGDKKMLYKIVIETDNLGPGSYKALLKANVSTKTGSKDFKSPVFKFRIVKAKPKVCPHKTK